MTLVRAVLVKSIRNAAAHTKRQIRINMGFGTLLGGYFLLLNFTYNYFTDIFAALLMLHALYKLSGINPMFKFASFAAAFFALLGFAEVIIGILEMMSVLTLSPFAVSLIGMAQDFIVGILTVLMLLGMRDVADEVGLKDLKIKCNYLSYVSLSVYVVSISLQAIGLTSLITAEILRFLYVLIIVATFALIIVNLTAIFSCYQKICMPSENRGAGYKEKPSRFGFVNKFRAHEEQKQKEYAEYKLDQMKKRAEISKQNGKKK